MTAAERTDLERRLCYARFVRSQKGAHQFKSADVARDCKQWDAAETLLNTRSREEIVRVLSGMRTNEAEDMRMRLNVIRDWNKKQRERAAA